MRKAGRDFAHIAVRPRALALSERVAQDQDARTGVGERNVSDLVVAKAQAVGEIVIFVAAPALDESAIGLEGVMQHRVADAAGTLFFGCFDAAHNGGAAKVVEGEKCGQAEHDGEQQQGQLQHPLPAGQSWGLSAWVHQLSG